MSKEKLIPNLRFPEFKNEGEWREETLGYFCDYWNGSGNEGVITEEGRYYLISLNSIDIEGNLKSEMKRVPNTDNSLKKGDLVMVLSDVAHGNFLGLTAIIPDDNYVLNQRMAGLGIKDLKKIDAKYLRLFINANQSYFKKQGQGSSQQNLSKASVVDFPVLVPLQLQEQQKIATCLSSFDEVIAAHSQKLELLKDHKKGLMQNLFPQEGEKVPKYRFKEFEKDGDWEEKKLNYYLDLLTDFEANGSFADVKENVNVFDEPNFAWYVRATDLEKKSDLLSVKYVDEQSYNFLNKTRLQGGELLITKRGEIGKVYIYIPFKNLPATVAPNMYLLKLNEKAEPKFFYYHFVNNHGNQSLKKLNASSTIGALYKDDVKNIILFAPSHKEQQKIASCLSSLDALITAQAEKIEQLKLHKKGLMQGLFPKLND